MVYVRSAEWKLYNANARGNYTGDCVKRALSLGLDMSYNEVSKLLNAKMKQLHYSDWNISPVYFPVMREHGCSDWTEEGLDLSYDKAGTKRHNTTLDEFVDEIADPSKTYIVTTGSRPDRSDHLVCVRDGKVWDSWDSRDQYVVKYSVSSTAHKPIGETEINFEDLTLNYIEPLLTQNIDKYLERKHISFRSYDIDTRAKHYKLTASCKLVLNPTDWIDKTRTYNFDIAFVLSPTMTDDEIHEYIKETAKVRTYDRLYAITTQEKKLKEAQEVSKELGVEGNDPKDLWMSPQEKRFYNSLPGWVKPLILYIMVQKPGQYSNSYTLRIMPLPNDNLHNDRKSLTFESYQADEIKEMLRMYKEDFVVPYLDYSVADYF